MHSEGADPADSGNLSFDPPDAPLAKTNWRTGDRSARCCLNHAKTWDYSLPSWIIGSSCLVLRSTASTIVRSSTPSAEVATAGMICLLSGKLKRIVKLPSGRRVTGSPCNVMRAFGCVLP